MAKEIDEYLNEAIPQNMKIPTVEGIALKLGISKETMYQWAKEYKEFSDALELVKVKQKEYLTEIGIFGGKEINSNIVALFLKANHGMIETERKQLVGDDNGPLEVRIIEDDGNRVTDQKLSETAVDL